MRTGDFSQLLNRRNAAGAASGADSDHRSVLQSGESNAVSRTTSFRPAESRRPRSLFSITSHAPRTIFRTRSRVSTSATQERTRSMMISTLSRSITRSSENDKVFARYATNIPKYFSITNNPEFSYLVEGRNNNLATQWLHLFSPTVINEARFGISESRDDSFNPRANTDFTLESIGIHGFNVLTDGNRPLTPREVGIPNMNISGFYGPAERDGGNGYDRNRVYQFNDNLAITTGAHTIKTGFDYRRVTLYRGAANVPRGAFNFTGNVAGNSFAAFLLGAPTGTESPRRTSADRYPSAPDRRSTSTTTGSRCVV